jgi:hypothetical protein
MGCETSRSKQWEHFKLLEWESMFWQNFQRIGNKNKNRQIGLHQIKKVLHSKGNNQQVKRQGTECDKVFAHDI